MFSISDACEHSGRRCACPQTPLFTKVFEDCHFLLMHFLETKTGVALEIRNIAIMQQITIITSQPYDDAHIVVALN